MNEYTFKQVYVIPVFFKKRNQMACLYFVCFLSKMRVPLLSLARHHQLLNFLILQNDLLISTKLEKSQPSPLLISTGFRVKLSKLSSLIMLGKQQLLLQQEGCYKKNHLYTLIHHQNFFPKTSYSSLLLM